MANTAKSAREQFSKPFIVLIEPPTQRVPVLSATGVTGYKLTRGPIKEVHCFIDGANTSCPSLKVSSIIRLDTGKDIDPNELPTMGDVAEAVRLRKWAIDHESVFTQGRTTNN